MSLIVQKFGGTSVANTERLKNVADIVTKTAQAGNQVVVVVSAQGDTTDDLIVKAAELNDRPSKREMDVLLNTGEMISMSLLAMAIQKLGFPVVSLTGWQIGLETNSNYSDARIKRIAGDRLKAELDNGRIVIVAGFQGINKMGDVTTLGRGGSDTTAVAIAATLGADLCQIYTDVDGVYTADPRIVKDAKKLEEVVNIVAKYVKAPAEDIKAGLPYIDKDGKLLVSDIATQIKWYTDNKMISGKLEAKDVANTSFLDEAMKK